MNRWQYRTLWATDIGLLDQLGADGWELAGVVNDPKGAYLIFKRPKSWTGSVALPQYRRKPTEPGIKWPVLEALVRLHKDGYALVVGAIAEKVRELHPDLDLTPRKIGSILRLDFGLCTERGAEGRAYEVVWDDEQMAKLIGWAEKDGYRI